MKGLIAAFAALAVAGCAGAPALERADLVAEPDACAPKRFDVYFRDGEAELTDAARHAIGLNATQLQGGCDIRSIEVIGLADARGAAGANLGLSERRAVAVAEALAAAGLPAPTFTVMAAGDSGAVTADGAAEPMRRRTEVLIHSARR